MSRAAVLILFAHPAFHKSLINRRLAGAVRNLEGITFHDLYDRYPELDIDVEAEQQLLVAHDVLVMQHPFYWYSTPAILKEWQDLVLEHGWAYGQGGDALRGKILLSAITTGGREQAYQPSGYNRYTMRQLLAPLEQTAMLCRMTYLPPFVVHGTHLLSEQAVDQHAEDYRRLLLALRDRRIEPAQIPEIPRLNADLDRLLSADTLSD